MDRGIKIAILAACLLSLGFGLVWDKFIDGARRVIKDEPDPTAMGPTPATLRVGDTSLPEPVRPATTKPTDGKTPIDTTSNTGTAAIKAPEPAKPDVSSGIPVTHDTPAHIKKWIEQGIIKDGKYLVQSGDSPRGLARNTKAFRYLSKSEADWLAVNPQFKDMDEFAKRLRAGSWLTIPQ